MALRARNRPERTCHFEAPEHVPRISVMAQTCVRGPGGLPAYHGAESTRKDPQPEAKKCRRAKKNTFIFYQVYIICIHTHMLPVSMFDFLERRMLVPQPVVRLAVLIQ